LSPHGLTAALDRGQLVAILNSIPQSDSLWEVKVIDLTGCEFWFHTGQRILAPGLGATWTKRKLIELYHDRCADGQNPYKPHSLQNYRLGKIIEDIAHLLNMPDSTAHAERARGI
jgi:hypothetical protein